jgi:hypothetical protein
VTRHTLTFAIDVPSTQKATALREKLAEVLAEDGDVTLVNRTSSADEQTFRVLGVDGTEPFDVTVSAADKEAARSAVEGKGKSKVVAAVLPMP